MHIRRVTTQLRTTDLAGSIRFYTEALGFELAFTYDDFYAGLQAGTQLLHLKLVDTADPSIAHVDRGEHFHLYLDVESVDTALEELRQHGVAIVRDAHDTDWGTREMVIKDDQGHTIYLGEARSREH